MPKSVVVLASGGIDSTAVISFYKKLGYLVNCVHFQYKQRNARSEREAVDRVAKKYHVVLEIKNLGFRLSSNRDEVVCRNAIFVLAAAALAPAPTHIALGIHSGSPYYDSSPRFIRDCQRMLDGFFGGTVRVEAPFIEYTKKNILQYCKTRRVPINLTYSCVRRNAPPCGKCVSCKNRAIFDAI